MAFCYIQTEKQFRALFKIGTGKLDIKPPAYLDDRNEWESNCLETLNNLPKEEINTFLDYQLEGHEYPHLFYLVLESMLIPYAKDIDNESFNIYSQWLEAKTNLSYRLRKEANKYFRHPSNWEYYKNFEELEYEIIEFTKDRLHDENLKFLAYGKKLLDEGVFFHKMDCNKKDNCGIENDFFTMLDFIDTSTNKINQQKINNPQSLLTTVVYTDLKKEKLPAPKQSPPPPTFLNLFKNHQERLDKFILLLQSDSVQGLDKEKNWIYNNRKSSIVACFQALEDLDLIKKITNKASLRRCIKSEINFQGDAKLFRNPINDDDYQEFKSIFSKNL